MDVVGDAIKNAIDDAVVAAKSIPDVSVRSANDIVPIINLANVAISIYKDQDTENVKSILAQHLSISWKKFGILKVHEVLCSALCINEIQWEM